MIRFGLGIAALLLCGGLTAMVIAAFVGYLAVPVADALRFAGAAAIAAVASLLLAILLLVEPTDA